MTSYHLLVFLKTVLTVSVGKCDCAVCTGLITRDDLYINDLSHKLYLRKRVKVSVNMGRQCLCIISATVHCQWERLNTSEKKVSIIKSIKKNQDVQTKAVFRGKIIGIYCMKIFPWQT